MATLADKIELKMETPHVYKAMLNILSKLAVEKTADLPQNMGNKPYIEAHFMANELKKIFVANGLIVIPSERIVRHEVILRADRAPHIAVAVEATYEIVSTEDASSVVITGAGDGLASGTAVASNIASTNAFKNAFLRTFMVTEKSVEEQALRGVEDDEKAEPRAVTTAKGGATQKRDAAAAVVDLQDKVKFAWKERHEDDEDGYVALGISKWGDPENWATNMVKLKSLIKAVEAGEVA